MAERIAIIGLGRFGKKLAQALSAAGAEVIAIDKSRQLIEDIRDQVTLAIRMDSTEEEALLSQGINDVDAAVVAIGTDFEANALTTSILKSLGINRVISRAGSEIRGKILKRIGADEIVFPEHESAMRLVHKLLLPRLLESIDLGSGHSLAQLQAPRFCHNKTLQELRLRQKYNINIVVIKRPNPQKQGEYDIIMPLPDTKISPEDILWIVGTNAAISSFSKE